MKEYLFNVDYIYDTLVNKDIILNQIILSVDKLLLAQGFRGPYIRGRAHIT